MELINKGVYLLDNSTLVTKDEYIAKNQKDDSAEYRKNTIAYSILESHNTSGDMENLQLKFDSMASHDITYVGIIQTARASGMKEFPLPYVLTNCHNSLCAVGGTINEDDHKFALSAARKYGGIYVPTNMSVIHSYNREMMAGCGKMILASDSHTRYGALGTLGVGEGGGELAKQLVGRTYDIKYPEVVAIYLTGKPKKGVGPHDVALSIVGATYANGFVKNRIMEFVGDGVSNLEMEYRNAIDVMTTETTCLSSIWITDEKTEKYLTIHGRSNDYRKLEPGKAAYYDAAIVIDLSRIEPVIALPFHPSNIYTIKEFNENTLDILDITEKKIKEQFGKRGINYTLKDKFYDGAFHVDQAVIGGCSGGTFDNLCQVADILDGEDLGNGTFSLNIYPGSQPAYLELIKNGSIAKMTAAGAIMRECFCGPCFGAGDTPANGEFSIRHTTRNFPNREGSKPGEGQLAGVALMDALSIAATAINKGKLTPATELDKEFHTYPYTFNRGIYEKRIYNGFGKAEPEHELKMGPNIKDWPKMPELTDGLLVKVVSYITDEVTTTDELIPSGETSSFRSNPLRLSEFTLSRKDPNYVPNAKHVQSYEVARENNALTIDSELENIASVLKEKFAADINNIIIGSTIYANKPGDGSAREQAASCQRVLGGSANIAKEYATKRYRSNLINWGMIPFLISNPEEISLDDYIYIPDIRSKVLENGTIDAYVINKGCKKITFTLGDLTASEKQILLDGCLINYYKKN